MHHTSSHSITQAWTSQVCLGCIHPPGQPFEPLLVLVNLLSLLILLSLLSLPNLLIPL
jgi:hypothetical protein